MMTDAQFAAGVAALTAYVKNIEGWKASFISDDVYSQGVSDIFDTWDASSGSTQVKEAACGAALYQSITNAGYGSDVTPAQCIAAAQAVMTAALATPNQ
jgi:hypothetical protein